MRPRLAHIRYQYHSQGKAIVLIVIGVLAITVWLSLFYGYSRLTGMNQPNGRIYITAHGMIGRAIFAV